VSAKRFLSTTVAQGIKLCEKGKYIIQIKVFGSGEENPEVAT